jgi:hypothetical protein
LNQERAWPHQRFILSFTRFSTTAGSASVEISIPRPGTCALRRHDLRP